MRVVLKKYFRMNKAILTEVARSLELFNGKNLHEKIISLSLRACLGFEPLSRDFSLHLHPIHRENEYLEARFSV